MAPAWLAAWALISTSFAKKYKGNCGLQTPPLQGEPSDYLSFIPEDEATDLDDELWGLYPDGDEGDRVFKNLESSCKEPLKKGKCRTFGVTQWNLTNYFVAGFEAKMSGRPLCEEDRALLERLPRQTKGAAGVRCNSVSPMCKLIDGKVRLIGYQGELTRTSLDILAQFPHLFALWVTEVSVELEGDEVFPDGVRVLTIQPRLARPTGVDDFNQQLSRLAPLVRRQGKLQMLSTFGPQQVRRWQKVDLSLFCGLDLRRYYAFTSDVGSIPECWNEMKSLEGFYCTNCMMTGLPMALRGLQALKSFVAFRQSEMIPCLAKDLNESLGPCKPAWETLKGLKRQQSTGDYGDFQEGPSYMCKAEAYAFPFEEFLSLGWKSIEKVWLDGNFLTGGIPEGLAEAWPNLQSLDLYENEMEGEIPEALGKLDFVKLQLNGNDFSGTLPKGLAKKRKLHLGVAGNPRLHGCVLHDSGLGDTQVQTCSGNEL